MIELKAVTPDNYIDVLKLNVRDDQKTYVASNVRSIADCFVYEGHKLLAVVANGQTVGFCMWGREPNDDHYHIVRLMIDAEHQRKGYGRAAAKALVGRISGQKNCDEIRLSFVPGNVGAESLYASIGFERTGEIIDDEVVMALKV